MVTYFLLTMYLDLVWVECSSIQEIKNASSTISFKEAGW
jgi:hypothetical protein